MERRLINANDPVLWRLSVVMPDGNRYVPCEAIAEVPTVETGVHGEWIACSNGVSCSRCGETVCCLADAEMFSYCPNCGAKMDGGGSDAEK